jgi:hypothetical protein
MRFMGRNDSFEGLEMKHVSLDHEEERIKDFINALGRESEGSVLELGGEAVVSVFPAATEPVDEALLREAILKRRDISREVNRDWEEVDREFWESTRLINRSMKIVLDLP